MQREVINPQGRFIQQWNKVFVWVCLIVASLDPLFFYIPVIDNKRKCLDLDKSLKITLCVLRSITDLFYIVHIMLQFRTGFIDPSTRVYGRGELIEEHPSAMAKRYLLSYFMIDVLPVLPLPQLVILIAPSASPPNALATKEMLKIVIFLQYVPRILRMYSLYEQVTRTAGSFTGSAMGGAVFNFSLYMLASNVVGAVWYLISIERQESCWRSACARIPSCSLDNLYCGGREMNGNALLLNSSCPLLQPEDIKDPDDDFDFGIFLDALQSRVVGRNRKFHSKLLYCFWWGLRNLSSLGQNLMTSNFDGEILFAIIISIIGLILFSLIIGNMQVVIFQKMNEDLLDELYDRLKPALYTEMSFIIREGCPVDEMLFLVRGTLSLMAKDGGSYCGMELLPWALNSHPSSSSLPISTRTVQAVTDIEAYALSADDLKFVTSQFRLHSNQFQHIFRFYSPEWRTWAACFIQAAWRLHYRNRLMKSLREEEDRLQAALAKESIDSPSLGATINASRFATNALRALQRNHTIGAELSPTLSLLLQKPVGPDCSEKNDSGGGETS